MGLAIQLENRYRGVRSPHKFKGGVSGCIRECAEAQGKDFGLIATDKGWNSMLFFSLYPSLLNSFVVFVGGNGGANPVRRFLSRLVLSRLMTHQRHAELLAKDVPPSKVVRVIDRFLAYYIMTADRLQRTARWIENMDGGIEVSMCQSILDYHILKASPRNYVESLLRTSLEYVLNWMQSWIISSVHIKMSGQLS